MCLARLSDSIWISSYQADHLFSEEEICFCANLMFFQCGHLCLSSWAEQPPAGTDLSGHTHTLSWQIVCSCGLHFMLNSSVLLCLKPLCEKRKNAQAVVLHAVKVDGNQEMKHWQFCRFYTKCAAWTLLW